VAKPIPGFPERFPVRRDRRRPWRYRVVSALCRLVFRVLFGRRLEVRGRENIPDDGPLVIACNHLANWDPFLFGGYHPGAIFAMAKRELFRPAAAAWILAGCNCIPVDRGGADRQALRRALDILGGGRGLLIFIEGTRSRTGQMGAAEPGAGFLVRRTGARVLPTAVWGTDAAIRLLPWPRGGRIVLRYGKPFTVTATGDREIADEIGAQIAALLPPGYRGVYTAAAAELEARNA
jgi:1-acyl-sn-glycerol-3-phosphate acyltransferase